MESAPGIASAASAAGAGAGARVGDTACAGEFIRLAIGEPLVPSDLMTPPFREETRGLMRDLAALLLDRHLRRLARMRNPVDLRIARLLSRLDQMSGCVALGFARLADYASERLGLPARRARDLMALARGLASLPRIAAAFESGDISRSQVRLLFRVATSETEESWLARARMLNVRRLEREVRAALGSADGSAGGGAGEGAGAVAGDEVDDGATTPTGAVASTDDDDAPAGEWVDLPAPNHLRAVWDRALDLARRASGAPDPIWSCVEIIAADFLSGVPDLASILVSATNVESSPDPANADPAVGDEHSMRPCPDRDDTDLFEEVIRTLEDDSGARRWAPAVERLDVLLPESSDPRPDDSARTLDRRLRELVRLRQNIAWHQGRLLRLFAGRRLHRELGFLSFSRYCRERAGLGVRRAWELIALERRLWLLPRIADAYRSGTLSWVRAAAIARVATERTEEAWLRLAQAVTVRRLGEEVALAQREIDASFHGLPCDRWTSRRRPADDPSAPQGLDTEGRVQLSAPGGRGGSATDFAAVQMSATGTCRADRWPAGRDGWTRLRFWAPYEVAALWHQAMKVARALPASGSELAADGDHAGAPLADWQCAERILSAFLDSWSIRTDPAWRRHHRVFERDGWRCRVPGCSSRRSLQVHHVVFRSQGGGDEDANLAVLCAAHHLQGIHQGRLRCHPLPEGLLAWEFAPDDTDGPLARFVEDVEWSAARTAVAERSTVA